MVKPETLVDIINEIIKLTKDKKIEWKHDFTQSIVENKYIKAMTGKVEYDRYYFYASTILNRKLKLENKSEYRSSPNIKLQIAESVISSSDKIFQDYTSNPLETLYRLVTTGSAEDPESISFERLLTEIKAISSEKQE
jgi:hypothetical protein